MRDWGEFVRQLTYKAEWEGRQKPYFSAAFEKTAHPRLIRAGSNHRTIS
jgi:hypothetical protein